MSHIRKRLATLMATLFAATVALLGVTTAPAIGGPGEPLATPECQYATSPIEPFAFCDLENYTPQKVDDAQGSNFRYTTTFRYWSVVAVRSAYDFDLKLYDGIRHSNTLAASTWGSNSVDFVAVDSNRRATDDDLWPYVYKYSGPSDAGFTVELAQGTNILSSSAQTFNMSVDSVVVVRDTYLSANKQYTFKLYSPFSICPINSPCSGSGNGDLFLMSRTGSVVQPRSSAVKSSTSAGFGGVETITYTPTQSGYYGVVVVQVGGSGSYKLERY